MESGYTYPERSEDNLAAAGENAKAETHVSTNNNIRGIIRSQPRS